jgi:hypothetical protein
MSHSDSPSGQSRRRRLKHFALALIVMILLAVTLYGYAFVRVVPPISAKVVDAITAKPVPGINVCLQVDTEGLGHPKVVRTEMARTDDTGRFFFWPSVHGMLLLQDWRGFSIRLTDPRNDFAVPCGPDLGPGLNEIHPDQFMDRRAGRNSYFPVAFVERTNAMRDNLGWSATRRPIGFPLNMYVSLIPVLSKVDDCHQVQDHSLAESCWRLNTEATAIRIER